jgi:hypothetical protein
VIDPTHHLCDKMYMVKPTIMIPSLVKEFKKKKKTKTKEGHKPHNITKSNL